ncbi:MAG: GNAT family N-acetyltransferase [Treponema sp.]|jgi:GNAT superfamily N-acetyltransferase|nr:GNAT family N-acetyltransferase [Treponema sp.]
MQFELTEALMDDILFSMEDQGNDFFVDAQAGIVVGKMETEFADDFGNSRNRNGRYLALPLWDSSHGYRLMERFAAAFRNPLIRDELTAALNRGKGVFRAFKNILSQHPEAEKLWFSFKEREMKKEILDWYNALREEWGLERIGREPEETDDLVFEDFRFRCAEPGDAAAAEELHRYCIEEYRSQDEKEGFRFITENFLRKIAADWRFPGDLALVAETGGGDFAAYISAVREEAILRITALEVKSEYRGLGIGEALLSHLLETLDGSGPSHILLDLPAGVEGFSRVLLRECFKPYAVRYVLYMPDRKENGAYEEE